MLNLILLEFMGFAKGLLISSVDNNVICNSLQDYVAHLDADNII